GEARARGERFYHLVCEIDDSAPLKYPKAYLVVNNLEVATNVIRSVPSFETTEDQAFAHFEVYFTASIDEEEIRDTVDVDQVTIRSIGEIAFKRLEEAGEVPAAQRHVPAVQRGPSSIRVEHGHLDDLLRRLRALHAGLERLRRLGSQDESGIGEDLFGLADEVPGIEKLVREMRQVPFSEEFRHVPWLVQDLAARLGKRVRLVVTGDLVKIDRRLLSMLSEPLVHLIRNAVDHGIEGVEERASLGKEEEGVVMVSAVAREEDVILQVADDGRGISKRTVEERARELGFDTGTESGGDVTSSSGLLELLARPGFSTRSEPTAVSGRGVGLDAIYQKVHQSLGGELRLQTQVGRGSLFTIAIPGGGTMMSLLIVRCGKLSVGVPMRDIAEIVDVDSSAFATTTDGFLSFQQRTVRFVGGRALREAITGTRHALIVLQKRAELLPFLCDEVLFERDVPEDRLTMDEAAEHGIRRVKIGEADADFSFLDISAVE
ncbi:MAG TPA: ATP-binding protein, partial [Spirochaetia bacterium]|nr:ATP-binding protein [Spirochaetia bacterium]